MPFAECQVDLGETVAVDKRQFAIPGLEEEEDNLCCLESNIIKNIVLDANNKTCSDFEGFQCVTANVSQIFKRVLFYYCFYLKYDTFLYLI